MKGDPSVLTELNQLLVGELTAADQYLAHSRRYRDWGYTKLFERVDHEMQEELTHADTLIKRILFLEGVPDVASRFPLKIGETVPEMLSNDLEVEYHVVGELRRVMALCEQLGDYVTRGLLQALLKDTEEDHAYWLETQLRLIQSIGLPNFLQSQI